MAVAIPVAHLPEDAVDVRDIGVGRLEPPLGQVEAQRIESLLVLAPADVADEALIVDQDALAARFDQRIGNAFVTQPELVEFADVRIDDGRVLRTSVDGAVVIFL